MSALLASVPQEIVAAPWWTLDDDGTVLVMQPALFACPECQAMHCLFTVQRIGDGWRVACSGCSGSS